MRTGSAHYLKGYSSLLALLDQLGFELTTYSQEPEAFGNFYADFSKGNLLFRIVRDRLQLFVEGEREELEPFELWQAFDDATVFEAKLLAWLRSKA